MDQEEKAIAIETMQGLLEGLTELFNMVLDNAAPEGYEVIIKKSGTDYFCRERTIEKPIKWSEQHKAEEKETVTLTKEQYLKVLKEAVSKRADAYYSKGYKEGYAAALKVVKMETDKKHNRSNERE